ncbi:MAG: hypothetical protein ABF298_07585 [Alteriqipengyuania sp.]
MAIRMMPFYTLILRTSVEQEISAKGWRYLFHHCDPHRNFDGEIMVFGAMSGHDIEIDIDALTSFGFIGPDNGESSDMVVWQSPFGATSGMPSWLSVVDVKFFDDTARNCKAWKLSNSEVYRLIDFHSAMETPTKVYEWYWPPLIGKIG